jgi:hypothetical protein
MKIIGRLGVSCWWVDALRHCWVWCPSLIVSTDLYVALNSISYNETENTNWDDCPTPWFWVTNPDGAGIGTCPEYWE